MRPRASQQSLVPNSQGYSAPLIRIPSLFIVLIHVPAPVRTLSCCQRRSGVPLCLHFCKIIASNIYLFIICLLPLTLLDCYRGLASPQPYSQSLGHTKGSDEGKKVEEWLLNLTGPFRGQQNLWPEYVFGVWGSNHICKTTSKCICQGQVFSKN